MSGRGAIRRAEWIGARVKWYAGRTGGRARIALRDAATAAGVRLRPERLVIGCASGAEASGLFSEVAAVVGCLAHYEARRGLYAGVRVDFQDHGLYYEPAAGANWWQYYFEPIEITSAPATASKTIERIVPPWQHDDFAEYVELAMPRDVAAGVVERHVRVRESIRLQIDRYWAEEAGGSSVIGIHYRGTDKWEGAPPVPYDAVTSAVRQAQAATGADSKIFVATDEHAFLEHARSVFPGRVLFRPMRRSTDGQPIHFTPGNGFRKGEYAVIDCLLLSRCAQLVRTDSDLSLFSTFFNPALPETMLGIRT